jgi:dCTP deaminase
LILSYNELVEIVEDDMITALPDNINGSSIDIRLGHRLLIEKYRDYYSPPIDLTDKSGVQWSEYRMDSEGYVLAPGEFILAHTMEVFNMPSNISGEFKLKSTAARNGLGHALAAWADPYWTGSVLTLELMNHNRYHSILLQPGMKIGQMIFHRHQEVPYQKGYGVRGSYNGDMSVSAGKGIK